MNLLFTASLFYPDTMGGSDRYLYEVTRRLIRQGHKVTVLTANPGGLPNNEIIEGISVHRYPISRVSSLRYYLSSIFNSQKAIILLVKSNSFDLLILNHILPSFGAHLATKNIPNLYQFYAPYLLEFQDKIKWEIQQNPGITTVFKVPYMKVIAFFIRRIEKYIIWKSKRILVLSEYSKNQIQELYRYEEKAAVIPCGIDRDKFGVVSDKRAVRDKLNLPADVPILLTIRRLYHRMGLEELIIAVKKIREAVPNILLLIGGKGQLRERLQKLVDENNLGNNVRFLGYIDEDQITEYYNAADYFILPTRALEGFGLVTIEALACGTPVLGTRVGATTKILGDLDPILLFDDVSSEAFSKKIIYMIKDYPDYSHLSEKCRDYAVSRFSWTTIMPEIAEFYQRNVL